MQTSGHRAPDARVACAGFGLGAAIVLYGLLVWSPASLFSYSRDALYQDVGYLASTVFGVALLVAGIGTGLRMRRRAPAHNSVCEGDAAAAPAAPLSGSARVCAGSLMLCAALWVLAMACAQRGGWIASASLSLAGAASGVALAAAHLWWVAALARLDARRARQGLVLAAAFSGAVNLSMAALPHGAERVVAFVLVACDIALTLWSARRTAGGGTAPSGSPGRTPRETAGALAPILIASAVVTLAAPLVNTVLMVDALELGLRIAVGGGMDLAVALVLFALWVLPRRVPSPFSVMLGYIAVFFAALVLMWIAGAEAARFALLSLGSAGFFLAIYLIADACLGVGRSGGPHAAAIFGVCGGIFMLARVAADVLAYSLLGAGITDEAKMLVTVFLLVYLLTCAAFLLFGGIRRRGVRRDERRGPDGGEPDADRPALRRSEADPAADDATRCERIAATYGLSQREREVLALMMRGRNVPAIAEELVLSRNTVQTHVRHLYEQLGVHSRQELIAFVERDRQG